MSTLFNASHLPFPDHVHDLVSRHACSMPFPWRRSLSQISPVVWERRPPARYFRPFLSAPGSRGRLPCPSPLRTTRDTFASSRSSLSNPPWRDAASPLKVLGYELGYGNLGEAAPGSLADLLLHLPDVRYGGCSIP